MIVLAGHKIVHWLLDVGKFSISARAMLATNFRAQVLLSEGSAHSFGGVQELKFCTAANGRLLFMFIVAMFICGESLSSPSKQWRGNVCHIGFGIPY